MPLFWDQVDNAQRVEETGFGRRLSTYGFRDKELTDAIDELLKDRALAARLAAMSARIKASSGTVRAADLDRAARDGPASPSRPDRRPRNDRRPDRSTQAPTLWDGLPAAD